MTVRDFIEGKAPCVLDGGLSNVLEEQGYDLNHPLWTAHIQRKAPEALRLAYLKYLRAGAHCLTTSTYQASLTGLRKAGFSEEEARDFFLESIQIAQEAIEQAVTEGSIQNKPLIAASVGPYGAYLADGSEYTGNYGVSDEELRDFHFERLMIMDSSFADILACETIPSAQEARILAQLLVEVNTPAWVSFSCKDEAHLHDGSTMEEVVSYFEGHPKVFAIGINCTHPRHLVGLITRIRDTGIGKKIIVYPNSGEAYHAATKTWLGTSEPNSFAEMTKEWLKSGANIIGGCCRIGPQHIKGIAKLISDNPKL